MAQHKVTVAALASRAGTALVKRTWVVAQANRYTFGHAVYAASKLYNQGNVALQGQPFTVLALRYMAGCRATTAARWNAHWANGGSLRKLGLCALCGASHLGTALLTPTHIIGR